MHGRSLRADMTAKALTLHMNGIRREETVDDFLSSSRPMLYSLALKITGNRESAEDATQEALFKAARAKSRLAEADEPGKWLRKVLVRCAVDRIDRKPVEELPELASHEDPDQMLAVQAVLARLEPKHRTILALALGEGLNYKEIGELLNIPEGTVGSRLHTAKGAFQKEWDK